MFNDKILKSVAEAVKQVLTTEKLHPNQQKLDVHEPKKDKLTSKDFEMLRKGKKADVKEANNPFDYKNYKSQIPTKPGEKAGFDSKKISTGTVYTRKPVKDEKPVKEGASQEDYLKEIEMAKKRAQGEGNPDLTKDKVTAVKQESVEQIDELSVNKMLKYSDSAEKDRKKLNAKWDAGTASRKEQEKAIGREEGENRATNKIKKKTGKYPWQLNREETEQAGREVPNCVPKNGEVEHIEERSMTEPEMKKREKIVKSMKKGMQGFKDRYGDRAKDVMYATATKQAMKD